MVLKVNESEIFGWLEPGTELVITHEKETLLGGNHSALYFTPVVFKSQQKGLKVRRLHMSPATGEENTIAYTTLSNEPMEMNEDDLEMVWKDGKMRPIDEYQAIVLREKEEKGVRL
jgi:hypothetical protein